MYELSVHPSTYYRDLFEAESIVILPALSGGLGRTPPGRGMVEIKASGDLDFEVYFSVHEEAIRPDDVRTAEAVLS